MYGRPYRQSSWRDPRSAIRSVLRPALSHGGARLFGATVTKRLSGGSAYQRAKLNSRGLAPYAKTGMYGRGSRYLRKKKDIMAPGYRGRSQTRTPARSRSASVPSRRRSTGSYLASLGSGRSRSLGGQTVSNYSMRSASSRSASIRRSGRTASVRSRSTSSARVGRGGGASSATLTQSKLSKSKNAAKPQLQYQKYGSVTVFESGGVVSDPQCVYVGAGTPVDTVFDAFCRVIITAVKKKAGSDITNWNDHFSILRAQQLDIIYIPEGATTATNFFLAIAANTTCATVAYDLRLAFQSKFGEIFQVHFIEARLFELVSTGDQVICTVPLQRLMVDLEVSVSCSVQNQTPSDTDGYTTDAINANPMKGKQYECNGNYFTPANVANRGDALTGEQYNSDFCVAEKAAGVLKGNPYDDATKKPPSSSFFSRINSSSQVTVLPGQVHTMKAKRTQTMSWAQAMTKLLSTFYDSPAGLIKNSLLGCSVMIALEKCMDTRLLDETPIILGYQTEVWVKAAYHYKTAQASAVINVLQPNSIE